MRDASAPKAAIPKAAIIVPSYNRPEQLRRCLGALLAQDHPSFEVIVVDDGSSPPLAGVCAPFAPRVRYIRQDNAGPAAARNTGAASSKAAFIALTDDDCLPRPDWLATLQAAHGGDDARLVGGRVENGLPADRFAAASQSLCDFLYDYFGASSGKMPFFTSNNMGLGRAAFEKLGGFDKTFPLAAAEDREFGLRWREEGGESLYVPNAVIDHFHAMTLRKFWRQHSNYGAGAYHLHRVLDARRSDQPKHEPLRFYLDLLTWPVRQRGLRGTGQMVLMGLSQVAMVNGFARAARRGFAPAARRAR